MDEPALTEHFKSCGNIVSVHIRCSGGIATTVKPQPNYYQNHRVHQYGVITFTDKRAVRNAILLDGSQLGGCEIVVSDNPYRSSSFIQIILLQGVPKRRRTSRSEGEDPKAIGRISSSKYVSRCSTCPEECFEVNSFR